MAANRIGFSPFVDEAGDSIAAAFYPPARGDDAQALAANGFTFGFSRYSKSITVSPPSGFIALPVSVAAALSGADSIFTYLGFAAEDGDQAVVATAYSGGTLTWATSSGNATGIIASYTGSGDAVFTLNYWRQATTTWYAIPINVQSGAVVAGTGIGSNGAATTQTIAQPALTAHAQLTTAGIANTQTLGSPTLQRGIAAAKISNDSTLSQPSILPKYSITTAGIANAVALSNSVTTGRAPATYSRSITVNPPSGFAAYPIAAASASVGANSAFRLLGFTPADGDQAVLPATYSAGSITWATSSGNATGLITSVTGAGNDVLPIMYWRASNETWYSLSVTMVAGVIVAAASIASAGITSGQSIGQAGINGLPLNTTYSRSITLNPPSGFLAYPISAATALTSSDSAFANLSGPANNDQCVVPSTYSGGNITWETSGGHMTGRIASHTGAGNATLSLEYWRSVTGTWSTINVAMVAGAIVAAGPASLSNAQALGGVTLSGTAITYSRAITLNPPAGNTAYPINSDLVTYATDSIFYGLVGTAVTGDQCVPPVVYDDSGIPRVITWELSSGCMTGRIAEVDGPAPTSMSIPYWDSTTQTWFTLSITLDSRTGLTTASAAHVQSLGAPSLIQHNAPLSVTGIASVDAIGSPTISGTGVTHPIVTPAGIANAESIAQPSLLARFTQSVNSLAHAQAIEVSGVKRGGGVGVFSLANAQAVAIPSLLQRASLVALPLYHVQSIGVSGIGFRYELATIDVAQTQSLSSAALSVLNAHRLDSKQVLSSPYIEMPIQAFLYGEIDIYPALTATIEIVG